jgi:hypothetical protein
MDRGRDSVEKLPTCKEEKMGAEAKLVLVLYIVDEREVGYTCCDV